MLVSRGYPEERDDGALSGYLEVITGGMFSGKTEELLRRVRRVVIARKRAIVVKPSVDDRYDPEAVASHDGRTARSFAVHPQDPGLIARLAEQETADVVAVDEAQFFAPAVVDVVEDLVAQGRRVVVAGLDLDFAARPFGSMPWLMAMADEVLKLKAICAVCGEPATYNQRLVNGQPVGPDAPLIQIGGLEAYQARCRRCYVPVTRPRTGAPRSG